MRLIHHHELHLHLVAGSVGFGIQNPGNIAVIVIKQTESDIGISYINYDGLHLFLFFRRFQLRLFYH